jgi:hypothetical protein
MDVLASIHDLSGRNISERSGSVLGLPMATHIVFAGVALPERNMVQIGTVRVDLGAVSEPSLNFKSAAAAIYRLVACHAASSLGLESQ